MFVHDLGGEAHVQRDVVRAVWNWREKQQADRPAGEHQRLRRAALLQAAIMFLVGALLFWGLKHHLVAQVVWGLAGLCLLLGAIWPAGYRPLHRFGQWLGRLVGQLLLYVLLVPFFYLFVLSVSLLLRLQGRDPLMRQPRRPDLTYWIPRRILSLPDMYEHQFLREDKHARREQRPVGTGSKLKEQQP
jgi:hypothetical protein